mmetsp:Transcript_42059/g.64763  ORF Transcript_42059/g.64763 Transcript_42059/m.64763 type:complete len:94 (+) Transcript_42059:169-450(+)
MKILQNKILKIKKKKQKRQKKKKDRDDLFNMFTDSPLPEEKVTAGPVLSSAMCDWDDDERYYKVQIGEIMNKKYEVTSKCGKGVFSTVVKAKN